MYASHGFLRSDIGDVDVVFHDGLYHLFHLVLPNHDFIAHAVSDDALNWRRVKNALFVGDPGEWDDDMLWTMHVSRNPDQGPGQPAWRMFYTGLSRREYGRIQRVGLATSNDLLTWERCTTVPGLPLEADGRFYESTTEEGRHWVSFRDPFFHHDPQTGTRELLVAGRIKTGPVIRRGCVARYAERPDGSFEARPPLHRPGLYDDIEVPAVFRLGDRHFMIGSIREDVKIHYWHADTADGPFENFFDNVLLPKGNYAGRITQLPDGRVLLFNFFAKQESLGGRDIVRKMLPPPKELEVDGSGRLRVRSYSGYDDKVESQRCAAELCPLRPLFEHENARGGVDADGTLHLSTRSGYQGFLLQGEHHHFRLKARLSLEGNGKCGMLLHSDGEGNGYYLSLDLIKGVAQLRAWGTREGGSVETAFLYHGLQAGYWVSDPAGPWEIQVLSHGMYREVCINGQVLLTLADDTFANGGLGFYTESAALRVEDLVVEELTPPLEEDHQMPFCTTTESDPERGDGVGAGAGMSVGVSGGQMV
ncbi:glycoside hydrolase family protein [Phycisphaera mikurensis]|uniref:beta-fructofuranosidase n=1 Tax=Phycisphaera mikurensis (strain NBRC 102666 / KCTC 22515 / FYK2301M01) TaxID=1142394 RepID=I0IH45_PHYMF|nr:glycosyhydrolase [Phycisphaera mikurensis]MBB6440837.1 beta-fructofuranosidase [Phycisphaera mikurensis]BAM04583.1 hypothetical protein PSMK_24240 [Phycisphaera mikurensis NBRC 102666]